MAVDVRMPKLGVEMTSGRVVEWKKGEGDWVEQGEGLLLIETEKITYEMESPASGYLHIVVPLELEVPVGELLAVIAESRDELARVAAEIKPKERAAVATPAPAAAPSAAAPVGEKVRITPLARRLAEERGVDLTRIRGTGPGDRITKEDVLQAAKEVPPALKRLKQTLPLKGLRRAIAERMFRSLHTTAQMSQTREVDMTQMAAFREELSSRLGVRISLVDIFVKAAAMILREQPIINASIEGDEIKLWEDINIGVAVALEEELGGSLIVPVVHGADKKPLLEIHQRVEELVDRARRRVLSLDEISGGTFTVNNVGAYDMDLGTMILNPPESAILGTGRIAEKPAVVNNQIVIRSLMNCTLTVDHRLIDGATGAGFVQRFKELMENPALLEALLEQGD